MPPPTAAQSTRRNTGRPRTRRFRPSRLWPGARLRRRWWRAFRSAPALMKVIIGVAVVLTLALAINWIYQVIRKPSELFFPGQRNTLQDTVRNVATVRTHLQKVRDERDHPRPSRGDCAGGGLWKSGGAHLLALVMDITALRDVPAGVERRRDVPDDRRHVCRSAALLHSRSHCRGGWALE